MLIQIKNSAGRKSLFLLSLLTCLYLPTRSQQPDPFDGKPDAFHVNLGRYFTTASAELASRNQLLDSVKAFQSDDKWTLENLHVRLDLYEQLLVELHRHLIYCRLSALRNTKDRQASEAVTLFSNAAGLLQTSVNEALNHLAIAGFTDKQVNQAGLSKYRYLMPAAKKDTGQTITIHDQEIIQHLSNPILEGLTRRYDELMNQVKADPIIISNGRKLNPITNRSDILENKDSSVRAAGTKAYLGAYEQHEEVIAAILIDLTRENTAVAKAYGLQDAPAGKYAARLQLTEPDVKEMLGEMKLHADVLKAYQRVQARQVKKMTDLTEVHSWDLLYPMGYEPELQTFAEAREIILKAFAPLGNEYVTHFAWLLSPENGALEIAGGPNRAPGGTSQGYPGVPISLYMRSYTGKLPSILTLAHEGGHAIHRQMMSENHIIPSYSSGPNFLFEAFALLNSILVLDELSKTSTTIQGKAYFTKQLLDMLAHEIFTSAEEGSFEQAVYDGVEDGKINTYQDIDSLYSGIMNNYDLFSGMEPARRSEWLNRRLFFDDPIYNINYLYGILVACKLYQMIKSNTPGFAESYTALLRNGFDRPAGELLRKFMGFSPDKADLLNGALTLMQNKTAELQKLYDQLK